MCVCAACGVYRVRCVPFLPCVRACGCVLVGVHVRRVGCGSGMSCAGGLALPYPKDGYWTDITTLKNMKDIYATECFAPDNCIGGDSAAGCFATYDNLTGCLESAGRFGHSMICTKGSKGRLCDEQYCIVHQRVSSLPRPASKHA